MTTKKRVIYLVIAAVIFLFGGLGILLFAMDPDSVNSYDECVEAGGAIQESYPERCTEPDGGKTFINPNQTAPVAPQ